jgi:hypothetical protein
LLTPDPAKRPNITEVESRIYALLQRAGTTDSCEADNLQLSVQEQQEHVGKLRESHSCIARQASLNVDNNNQLENGPAGALIKKKAVSAALVARQQRRKNYSTSNK